METCDPLTQAFATRYRETCDVVAARPTCGHDIRRHIAFGARARHDTASQTAGGHPRGASIGAAGGHRVTTSASRGEERVAPKAPSWASGVRSWLRVGRRIGGRGPWRPTRARADPRRARGPHTARKRAPRMRMRLEPSIETHAKRRVGCDARISAIKGACGESDRFRRPKNAAIGGGREPNRLRVLAPEGAARARGMRGRPAPPASAEARRARISGTRHAESSGRRETRGCPRPHFTSARARRTVRVLRAGGATPR